MSTATIDLRAKAQRKRIIIQVLLIVLSVVAIWGVVTNTLGELEEQGLTSGFGFLDRAVGWAYSFSLIPRSIDDTYARTLLIGFTNTLFVGVVSIILSTIFGFLIGAARESKNLALQIISSIYIQIFRNIPLILQVIIWYAILIHLPGPKQSLSLFDAFFLSNRGFMIPVLNVGLGAAGFVALMSIAIAVALVWLSKVSFRQGLLYWFIASLVICVLAVVFYGVPDEPAFSVPALKGLRFRGGLTVSIELVAMVLAIVLYGSAYVGEVVRGGLREVPSGLTEAGQALGLSSRAIWSRIQMPMALRTIIPPLGNQWIFIMKATTVGIAIGFSDMFYIVSTSITQSGQTLELIAILAGSFLLVNFSLAQFVNWLNSRMKLKAH